MAHTNVQLVSGNLTTGGDDPTFYIDRVNNKVGIGDVPDITGVEADTATSNVLQITGSVLATKYHGDGSSLTGLYDSKWVEYSGDASKIYYNGGNVGIGMTDPDSKLEVRGNIHASFSDDNHGMFIDAAGIVRRDYGGNGAGFHFTTNAIWPTNYAGSYSVGVIDLGSSSYRWNNVYTEDLNASGTVTATSFSGIQASDVPDLSATKITGGTFDAALIPTLNQDTTGEAATAGTATNQSGGTVSCTSGSFSGQFSASSVSSRDKFRVYPSSSYCIGMQSGVTFGDLNDWAMTFQMNSENDRGFWWGDTSHGVNQGAMALSTRGYLNVAERIKVGGGQTDTGAASHNLDVNGNAHISSSLECDGRIYADNGCHVRGDWLRVNSNRGIYFESYGGGWFMQDTTYVRVYSNKRIYTGGDILAGGNVTAYSDIRRKKDLVKLDNALGKVEQLTGYTYTSKTDDKRYTGLIAQDVQKVLPEAVHKEELDGHLSLAYGNMAGLFVEAIKELTRKNEILEARLNAIENNR